MANDQTMPKTRLTVSLETSIVQRMDALVARRLFPSRSSAIETALLAKLDRMSGSRLATECAKLDPVRERALADEGASDDIQAWTTY